MSSRSAPSRSAASAPRRTPTRGTVDTNEDDKRALDESVSQAIAIGLKVATAIKLKSMTPTRESVNPGLKVRDYKKRHTGTEQQTTAKAPRVIKVGRAGSLPATPTKPRKLRTRAEPIKATRPGIKIKQSKTKAIQEGRRPASSAPLAEKKG